MQIEKKEIIKDFATNDGDTGSPEVQVAVLTERIKNLTEHFKDHKKRQSFASRFIETSKSKKKDFRLHKI